MGALTISAVDHTTGQLTITGHGQVSGAGPAALYAAAGGAIPTGLAPITDYYLIVVDANTVKLAISSTNALAGTALSFSGNGTLPLQLLLGLPYRRASTYVPKSSNVAGSQIKSADLNAMQDDAIALWNFLTAQGSFFGLTGLAHGSREVDIDASAYRGDSAAIGTYDSTNHCLSSFTGVGLVIAPVRVVVGQRILTWQQFYNTQSSGATLTPKLRRIDLATGTIANVWAGAGDLVGGYKSQIGTGINHTVLAGSAYFAEVTVTNPTHRVHGAILTYDRPPG